MEGIKTFGSLEFNSLSVQEAAKLYIQAGLAVIPDKPKSKQPAIANWPNAKIGAEDIDSHFHPDSNLSVLLGKPSGGLVCVDIDHDAVLQLASYLPQTPCIHGRPGMPKSHYWYFVEEQSAQSAQFKHPNGSVLAEILGEKRKVTSPPSTHESGEKIVWEGDGAPIQTMYVALKGSVGIMCSAALFAMEWPSKGSRNEAALALAGMLLKSGMDVEQVEQFVRHVAKAAKDEEVEARVACVKTTETKIAQGEAVTGATRLGKLLGDAVVERASQWLNLKTAANGMDSITLDGDLSAMNDRHAVIQLGGSTAILNEDYDPVFERKGATFSRRDDLKLRYQHKRHVVSDPITGKPKHRGLAEIWLEWPGRRQYAGVEFNPLGSTPGFWNRYRGFAVAPKAGDCSLYLKHIEEVICRGNAEHFNYVLGWMAHAIQRPFERPETALVLRGKQGTGKGVFVERFGTLFGEHYFAVYKHEHITGRFNSHLMHVLLLHLNEAVWGGQKSAAGSLKGLITDPWIPIEPKGKDVFGVRNYSRVVVASNEAWAVPIDIDDRRFLVLDVSDARKEDHSYFQQIHDQMVKKGGHEALMFHLQGLDLEDFDVRKLPKSASAIDLKLQSAEPVFQWWFQRLKESYADAWALQTPKEMLHEQYLDWCKLLKHPHPLSLELFSKAMKGLVPNLGSAKLMDYSVPGGKRVSYFKLPALAECRKAVQDAMKADNHLWE